MILTLTLIAIAILGIAIVVGRSMAYGLNSPDAEYVHRRNEA